MWFERFVIIVTSLHRDFLPSQWGYFTPTLGGRRAPHRQLRPVLHAVPAVRALPADDRHRRGQDRDAAGGPAPRLGRRRPGARTSCAARPCRTGSRATALLRSSRRPAVLYRACEPVRDAGYTRWDAHTPFPVHGLDARDGPEALAAAVDRVRARRMGGAAGRLPAADLGAPRSSTRSIISGKPFFAWPAYVPGHVRAGRAGRRARRRARHVRAQPAAAAQPPAVRLARASSARATTASSSRSRRRTRGSTRPRRPSCCAGSGAARLEWLTA